MYNFKTDISLTEFNSFIEQTSFATIQQTESWSKLKSNWKSVFCGVYNDDKIVGVALILIRTLMPGFTYAYCPRGPIMDYTDKKALKAFTDGARAYCKQNGIYLLKVDPTIVVGKTLPDMDEDKYLDPFDLEKGKIEFDNLIGAGFKHKGFGKSLDSATQPRYNALIPLKDRSGNPLTPPQFKKNYKQKIRKYLGNFQPARGLFYEGAEHTEENIALFKKILSNTESRQNIALRNEEYFTLLANAFSDDAYFAFEKCNVQAYIDNLNKRFEKEPDMREKITEQLEDAKQVLNERGEVIPLAALLTVYPPNKTGIKIAEYLYAGSDLTIFSSFCATLCGLCEQCSLCVERDCDFLDLGGVSGTFDDGLFDFKNPFNPIIVEYAGEFDLVINSAKYSIMEKGLPILKKGYSKLRKLIKK